MIAYMENDGAMDNYIAKLHMLRQAGQTPMAQTSWSHGAKFPCARTAVPPGVDRNQTPHGVMVQ